MHTLVRFIAPAISVMNKRKRERSTQTQCAAGCVELPRDVAIGLAAIIRTRHPLLAHVTLQVSTDATLSTSVSLRIIARQCILRNDSDFEQDPRHRQPHRMEQQAREIACTLGNLGDAVQLRGTCAQASTALHAEEAALAELGAVDALCVVSRPLCIESRPHHPEPCLEALLRRARELKLYLYVFQGVLSARPQWLLARGGDPRWRGRFWEVI